MPRDYTNGDREDLWWWLPLHNVSTPEVEAALQTVGGEDPAGILEGVTHETVARVALHMNPKYGRVVYRSPWWERIVAGHPAARPIFYHELVEMDALASTEGVGIRTLPRDSETWLRAHAQACWLEAQYWSRWSECEGQGAAPEAFLLSHPARSPKEQRAVRQLIERSGVTVREPGRVESERARDLYRRKQLTGLPR
jgi:hypothetical protein